MHQLLSFLAMIFSELFKSLLTDGLGEQTMVSSSSDNNGITMPKSNVDDVFDRYDSLIPNK